MKVSTNMQRCGRSLVAVLSVVLLSGCLSQLPAPVSGGRSGEVTRATPQSGGYHVVQPGDTLMGIGRAYNRSVAELATWNQLPDPDQIKVGQRLRVTPPEGALPSEGVIVQPIDLGNDLAGTTPAQMPQTYQEPQGGSQPYTAEAWAALNPRPEPVAPAAPVPAPSEPTTPPPAAQTPPKAAQWIWPAEGPVIEKFDESTNKGIDIAGKPGDPVLASAAGSVAYSGSGLRGYGKLVIINHDGDYYTAYAHNQTLLVKEGEKVVQGQKIAEMGSTDTDRPKLHFEIRRQGRPVDPMRYLPAR